jgi:hypothetical protein
MHKYYGKEYVTYSLHKCKDCSNFNKYRYRGKDYKKCSVYGESNSEATDWNNSFEACSMFNCEFVGNTLIDVLRHQCKVLPEEQLQGQITVDEWLGGD